MMLDAKDPAIRLFGRTIQLAQYDAVSGQPRSAPDSLVVVLDCEQSSYDHNLCSSNGSVSPQTISDKDSTDGGGSVDLMLEHGSSSSVLENTSGSGDQTNSSSEDKGSSSQKASEKEEEEEEEEGGTSGPQVKPLKKPTKILPCPRCNSTDTKFCYFNNYNVKQPRHFCKKCQRYWTAGGTMRSMVIGAGRRKNKSSCLSQHPFVVPNSAFRAHPDALLSEPMASALTVGEGSYDNGVINLDAPKSATINFQSFGALWPNPWSPAHPSSSVAPPGFVPIYAVPPYWSCGALAWMPPASASADQRPNSPLGKHPRDGSQLKASNKEHHGEDKRTETKVLIPKTLRFDDPREAAQSSIWTTLGIKNEKGGGSLDSGAFFSGFQPKSGEMNSARLTSRLLQANPAALSRSFVFHECV